MSSSFGADLCRIVAPEKLPASFMLSGVLGGDTVNLKERPVLLYIFEVLRPWLPSSELLPSLEKVLQDCYSKLDPVIPLDDQLEEILRLVNQQLNAVSESGETDWIGNLNGLIGLFGDGDLHFSQTGHLPGFLLQNNRIRQITDDSTPEAEPHPLKTFSALASGSLQPGDFFLTANQELYNEISLDALRRIMNSTTPYGACSAIARELKREKNPSVSAIIFTVKENPPQDADKTKSTSSILEPNEVKLEEVLQPSLKKFQKKLMPVALSLKNASEKLASASARAAKDLGHAGVSVGVGSGKFVKDKIVPGASHLLKHKATKPDESEDVLDPALEEHDQTTPIVEIIRPQKRDLALPEDESNLKVGSVISAKRISTSLSTLPKKPLLETILYFITKKIPYYTYTGLHRFVLWLQIPRNKKITALAIALILVGSVLWSAFSGRGTTSDNTAPGGSNNQLIADAQNLSQKIDQSLSPDLGEAFYIEAGNQIEQALAKLGDLKNPTLEQKNTAETLWDKLVSQSDTITKTIRLSSVSVEYSFSKTPTGFIVKQPYLYGWVEDSASVYRTGNGATSEVQQVTTLPSASDPVENLVEGPADETIWYALTKNNHVWAQPEVSGVSPKEVIPQGETSFKSGDVLATFNNNLYLLDGKTGILWRYVNTGTNFNKGTSMISIDKYDIRNSISLSIDGSVYLLKSDGTLMKFNSGKLDESFSLKGIPAPGTTLVHPLQVYTSEELNSIYVLDGGLTSGERSSARILQFSKSGDFQQQWGFPKNLTNVSYFQINPKEKKLWVLNGSKVFEFGI